MIIIYKGFIMILREIYMVNSNIRGDSFALLSKNFDILNYIFLLLLLLLLLLSFDVNYYEERYFCSSLFSVFLFRFACPVYIKNIFLNITFFYQLNIQFSLHLLYYFPNEFRN